MSSSSSDWTVGNSPRLRPSLGEYAPPQSMSPLDAWLLSLSIWLMARATHLPTAVIRRVLGEQTGN